MYMLSINKYQKFVGAAWMQFNWKLLQYKLILQNTPNHHFSHKPATPPWSKMRHFSQIEQCPKMWEPIDHKNENIVSTSTFMSAKWDKWDCSGKIEESGRPSGSSPAAVQTDALVWATSRPSMNSSVPPPCLHLPACKSLLATTRWKPEPVPTLSGNLMLPHTYAQPTDMAAALLPSKPLHNFETFTGGQRGNGKLGSPCKTLQWRFHYNVLLCCTCSLMVS